MTQPRPEDVAEALRRGVAPSTLLPDSPADPRADPPAEVEQE